MAKAVVVDSLVMVEAKDEAVVEDEVIKQTMVMDVEEAVDQAMAMEEAVEEADYQVIAPPSVLS
jgi:hypothetical protein